LEVGKLPLFTRLQLGAGGLLGHPPPGRPQASLRHFLSGLATMVARTDEHELSCDECMQELDHLVELAAADLHVDSLMPLVMAHLRRCGDCYQEYDALLRIIRAETAGGASR
jgi:hypothetical protein